MIYLMMIVCYSIPERLFSYGKDQQLVLLKLNLQQKVLKYENYLIKFNRKKNVIFYLALYSTFTYT